MTGANSGSAGAPAPRPSNVKGGEAMAGANTGSTGATKPRPPKKQ